MNWKKFEGKEKKVVVRFFNTVDAYKELIKDGLKAGGEDIIAAAQLMVELIDLRDFWQGEATRERKPAFVGSIARDYRDAMEESHNHSIQMARARRQYADSAISHLQQEFQKKGIKI